MITQSVYESNVCKHLDIIIIITSIKEMKGDVGMADPKQGTV